MTLDEYEVLAAKIFNAPFDQGAGSYDDLLDIVRKVARFDKRDVTMMEMLVAVSQSVRAVKAIDSRQSQCKEGVLKRVSHISLDNPSDKDALMAEITEQIVRNRNAKLPLEIKIGELNRELRILQDRRREMEGEK